MRVWSLPQHSGFPPICDYNILTDLGVKVELNVSYAGGATLQSYWNNIESDNASYDFRKWREGEGWIEPETKSTYKDILLADDWDIVTHQQQSGNGGNYPSFQPYLHNIINFEKSLVRVMPLFFMHATWAYPNGSTANTEIFESLYGSNTDTMYNAVLDAYNSAMTDEGIINVMPSTPMVQQVRQLGIPNIDLTDGSHLNINGQFAVSCVWAEMLLRNYFDKSVASELSILSSTYRPDGLSEENAAKIRELAKTIVENVNNSYKEISFLKETPEEFTQPIKLKWNQANQRFEARVTDTNNMHSVPKVSYNWSDPTGNIYVEYDGSDVIICADEPTGTINSPVVLTAEKNINNGRGKLKMWQNLTDPAGDQPLGRIVDGKRTPTYMYAKAYTEGFKVRVHKEEGLENFWLVKRRTESLWNTSWSRMPK